MKVITRRVPAALLAAAIAASGLSVANAAATKKVRTGNSYDVQFMGNPSTGYIWTYNEPKSDNPGVMQVESMGYGAPQSKKLGAPAPYLFRLTCLKPGFAQLWFSYVSPSRQISEEHEHWARCE